MQRDSAGRARGAPDRGRRHGDNVLALGSTVREAVFVMHPKPAEIVTGFAAGSASRAMATSADLAPAGMGTTSGTVTPASLLASATRAPVAGALAVSVTGPVTALPTGCLVGAGRRLRRRRTGPSGGAG